MSKSFIDEIQLQEILQAHTKAISSRISNLMKHHNQLLIEYADNCIESITNLRAKEGNMLDAMNHSFTRLEDDMLKDLEHLLRKKPAIIPHPSA